MGRDLYATFPAAHAVFDQADHTLGIDLSRLCFDGPAQSLNDTLNTQPAILTTSIAALRVLEERGVDSPAYVAGHSMGEFSALVAASALSFEDGLKLVRERGRLMKEAGDRSPGGMAAILGMQRDPVEAICAEGRAQAGEYVGRIRTCRPCVHPRSRCAERIACDRRWRGGRPCTSYQNRTSTGRCGREPEWPAALVPERDV